MNAWSPAKLQLARTQAQRWMLGLLTLTSMIANLIFWTSLMLPALLLRGLPLRSLQRGCSRYCVWLAGKWVAGNHLLYRHLHDADWQVQIDGDLDPQRSYLLVANHQSWADILVLFDVFHARTPFARFFMKQELKYVPIIGQVCWAMDMPFMTRSSSQADLETMRQTCEIYREVPVTIVNFLEGTRSSASKRQLVGSPYRHLMPPKSGGFCYTLNAMGDQLAGIIDATIIYERSDFALAWSWLSGEQKQLRVHVRVLPLPPQLTAGEAGASRQLAQTWLRDLWSEKDALLTRHG